MKVISTQIAAINKYKKYLQIKNDKKEDSDDGEYSDDDIENENGEEVNSGNHTIPYNVLDIAEIKETEDCNGDDSFIEDDLDFKMKVEMKNRMDNVRDYENDLNFKINNGEDNNEDLHLEKNSEIENDIEVDNEDSINLKINNGKEDDKKDSSSTNQDLDLQNSTDIAELANDNDDDLDLDLNGDPEVTSHNEDDGDFEMIDEDDGDVGDYNEGKLDSLVSNVLELITEQEDDKEDATSHEDDNTVYNPDLKMKMEKKEENAEVNYDDNDLDFIYVTNFVKKEPKIKSEPKIQNDPEIKQESVRKYNTDRNKAKKKAFFKKRAGKYRTTEKGKEVQKRRSEKYRMSLRDNKGDQEENEDDKITKAVVKTDPEEIKASHQKASKPVVQQADTESDSDSEVMIVGNIDRDYSCKVPNCLADFWFPSQRDKHTESFHKSS